MAENNIIEYDVQITENDIIEEDIYITRNDIAERDIQVVENQNEMAVAETVEIIDVEDVTSVTIESEDAFPAIGESNENLRHSLLNGRELHDQHPIVAITGLREELDNIEALGIVYSNEKNRADYYLWQDENPSQENREGFFVTIGDDVKKIKLCTENDDIFGVIVNAAGFIGGQDEIARDSKYGLVMTSGVASVRCELDIVTGDYVVCNEYGMATKSTYGYGNKVLAIKDNEGVKYAVIAFTASSNQISTLSYGVKDIDERLVNAEKNIVSAINAANAAYQKANDAERVSSEADQNISDVMDNINNAIGRVSDMEGLVASVNAQVAAAKAIAENAAASAEGIKEEAISNVNNTLGEINGLLETLEPITTWEDPQTGNTGAEYLTTYIRDGLATKTEVETAENNIDNNLLAIQKNAKSLQTLASTIDKYSLGKFSQAYGLTYAQAIDIMHDGMIYVPIDNHSETLIDVGTTNYLVNAEAERSGVLSNNILTTFNYIEDLKSSEATEFIVSVEMKADASDCDVGFCFANTNQEMITVLETRRLSDTYFSYEIPLRFNDGYSISDMQFFTCIGEGAGTIYVRNVELKEAHIVTQEFLKTYHYTWDTNQWIGSASPTVTFTSTPISGSDQNPYAVPTTDITDDNVTYEKDALYLWKDNKWMAVATLAGNVLSRTTSLIKQEADNISAEITTIKGDVAGTKIWVDENKAAIQDVVYWESDNGDSIATTLQNASENKAYIAQVASVKDADGNVDAVASIVAAVNDSGSSVTISADKINFDGTAVFLGDRGRNFLLGSKNARNISVDNSTGGVLSNGLYEYSDSLKKTNSTTYIFSAEMRAGSISQGESLFISFYFVDNSTTIATATPIELTASNTYTIYEFPLTFEENKTINDMEYCVIVGQGHGTLYVRKAKLEVGNTASLWTPAYEDAENSLGTFVGMTTIDGANIKTGSIEASAIKVEDLVARKLLVQDVDGNDLINTHSVNNITPSVTIAGWKVNNDRLASVDDKIFLAPDGYAVSGLSSSALIFAGDVNDQYFYVDTNGKLYATGAEISGKITAGEISGWTINTDRLSSNTAYMFLAPHGAQVPNNDLQALIFAGASTNAYFAVDITGKLYAAGAEISGKITATSGEIGECQISDGKLQIKNANITGTIDGSKINGSTLRLENGCYVGAFELVTQDDGNESFDTLRAITRVSNDDNYASIDMRHYTNSANTRAYRATLTASRFQLRQYDGSTSPSKTLVVGAEYCSLPSNYDIQCSSSSGIIISVSKLRVRNGDSTEYEAFTGTKTISGTVLTFVNGILVQ